MGYLPTPETLGRTPSLGCQSDLSAQVQLRDRRQHGPKDFSDRGQVVAGDPVRQLGKLGSESRRRFHYLRDFADFCVRGCLVGHFDDHADHGFFAERNENAGPWLKGFAQSLGYRVGERRAQWHGQGDIAEWGYHSGCSVPARGKPRPPSSPFAGPGQSPTENAVELFPSGNTAPTPLSKDHHPHRLCSR
jgi:hypothetical protein